MKNGLICTALLSALLLGTVTEAEARSRCPLGKIYRPSQGVCQSKAAAIRQGVYRPRKAKRVRSYQRARSRPQEAPIRAAVIERDSVPDLPVDAKARFHLELHKWLTPERRRELANVP